MIALKKTKSNRIHLKPEDKVSETCITMVQSNNYQEVKITQEECRKSVRTLSSLRNKHRK